MPTLFSAQDNAAKRPDISEKQLLDDAQAGQTYAYEALMRRYNRRLYRIARSILGDEAEAEDVVQETYVKLFTRLATFRGPQGFGSWLCRIASNDALDRVRHAHRVEFTDDPDGEIDAVHQYQLPGPLEFAAGKEAVQLLEQAVDTLPEHFRSVFVMRAIEQLSVAETAACLRLKPETVKTRYHRARGLLQQDIENRVQSALDDIFPFAGSRCDRIVARVLRRLVPVHH